MDRVFRILRQVVGLTLLGGVVAGAVGGSGGSIALGAIVIGAEEFGLLAGFMAALAGLFIFKN